MATRAALIIGAGAIGSALAERLLTYSGAGNDVRRVDVTWHRTPPTLTHPQLRVFQLDPTNEASIAQIASTLAGSSIDEGAAQYDWIINCTGFLSLHADSESVTSEQVPMHPEKRLADIDADFFMENMRVNALPTLLLAKHLGPLLNDRQSSLPSVFATISAKVGSISDNRLGGWYSYRASKAALNMALKTLSIEWQRCYKNRCVVALHPGTTQSRLSKPFSKQVPADKYFSPAQTAHYLIEQLSTLRADNTGEFIAWSGERLVW